VVILGGERGAGAGREEKQVPGGGADRDVGHAGETLTQAAPLTPQWGSGARLEVVSQNGVQQLVEDLAILDGGLPPSGRRE
jgi:hypothetical protein